MKCSNCGQHIKGFVAPCVCDPGDQLRVEWRNGELHVEISPGDRRRVVYLSRNNAVELANYIKNEEPRE